MKNHSTAQISLLDEIYAELFAGGGGFSTGFSMATGRVMDIAVNHDPAAILMHKTNHPHTEHYQEDVFLVDPTTVCRGRPVGLLWASPDCKHFSKAKGEPLVDRKIRGLSWVVLRWALDVQPRVIGMENVEEIQTWGPLMVLLDAKTGRPIKYVVNEKGRRKKVVTEPGEVVPPDELAMTPDPAHKGETFQAFIGMLSTGIDREKQADALAEACEFLGVATDSETADRLVKGLGYDLDYRELVAADYGAPTTRKRWVLVARRDGRPIVWPERTHAPRNSEEVKSGKLLPWRSAAEIIDWSRPMYSIFESKEEIKAKYGVNAQRPLADNTQRRIIRGVDKFTIKSGKPFIVQGKFQNGPQDIERPLTTVTAVGAHELVEPVMAPFLAECNHAGEGHLAETDRPLGTITQKCTKGVCAPVMAPFTFPNTQNSVGAPANQPVHTITSAGNQVLAAAQLMQYHDEGDGPARASALTECLPTIDGSNRHGLVVAHITEYYGNGQPIDPTDPMHTVTGHDREGLTAAILQPFHAGGYHGRGNSPEEPVNTVTSSGGQSLVAAHIVEFKGEDIGQRADKPLRTITASWGEFAVAGVKVEKYDPAAPFQGWLGHWPEIRALLNQYCGYTLADDEILLLNIGGVWHYIDDILLRMLMPRELYAAQGFPADYIIERDYTGRPYPKNQQVARCGNSVSPQMAAAVVRANFPELAVELHTMAELERIVAV